LSKYRKPTRRERFLDEMNRVVQWAELTAAIKPFYPKAEGPWRPPVIKRIFGWSNVRYRGLAKNTHWLFISCGLATLYVARRRLQASA
jgi:hypothetical protein